MLSIIYELHENSMCNPMKYAISFDDDVDIPNNSTSLSYIVEVYAKRALQPIKTHESSIRISVQSSLFSILGFFCLKMTWP